MRAVSTLLALDSRSLVPACAPGESRVRDTGTVRERREAPGVAGAHGELAAG